jgi:hypothetical protein
MNSMKKAKGKPKAKPYRMRAETLGAFVTEAELLKRERRIRRVLTLEQLLQMNQRVEEQQAQGFAPPPYGVQIDERANGELLRLLWGNLLLRPLRQHRQAVKEQDEWLETTQALAQTQQRLLGRIAAVLSQTWVELGEGALLADDEGLGLIRDVLLDYEADLIERHREPGWILAQAYLGCTRK